MGEKQEPIYKVTVFCKDFGKDGTEVFYSNDLPRFSENFVCFANNALPNIDLFINVRDISRIIVESVERDKDEH